MHLVTRNILISVLLLASAAAQGQVARVLEVKGTTLAERAGQPPRILGADDPLDAQQVVTVARDSHVILEFADKARVTLRPGTVFRIDAYREDKPESAIFGLLKGGLRAISGLIAKRNPGAVKYQTASATIGIRGTEFDARLCEEDCAVEDRLRPGSRSLDDPVARVVEMKGTVAAARAGELARMLVPGAAIHERDGVATGANSYAVLVFSDGSRIALSENSRLAIPAYRFDDRGGAGFAELHHLGGVARVVTGAIAKQGPEYYRFVTPMGEVRPRGTVFDSVAGGAKQVADESADAARGVVGAVQDTAGQAVQTALNAAITPILQTMSALMTGLRDNPPTTEAGWNDLTSQMTRMSDRLHGALDEAIRVGGAAIDSPEFKTAVGLALAAEFEMLAVGAALPTIQGADAGIGFYAALITGVQAARSNTYQSESLALVGLSGAELDRVSYNRYAAHVIIETEIGSYLASTGSAAARDFFAVAQSAAQAMQQRAQKAEAAAARAAEEAKQREMDDAARLADEARDAEREAARLAAEGKVEVEQAGQVAVRTVLGGPSSVGIDPGTLMGGSGPADTSPGAPAPPPVVGETIGDVLGGEAVRDIATTIMGGPGSMPGGGISGQIGEGIQGAKEAGQSALDDVKRGTDAAGAQSEKVLRAIEELRSAEREFARRVADLKNALDGMTNLSETEKRRVRDTLDEWSRLVREEVARKIAEVTQNPNAQIVITTLQIMGTIVAVAAVTILVGAPLAVLAILTAVAHTAITDPSVFDGVPTSVIAQAKRGPDQASEAMRGILAAMVEHGKLGADEARRFMEAMGQDTLDTTNTAKAQLQKDLQELNNSKAADRRYDAGEAQDARDNVNQAGPSGVSRTEPASPAQVVVWDGSVEVAGHVVNKGESLQAASDGQLVSGPSSSAPETNAPRPDLVKVAPGLFADGEIVSGPVSEAIAKRFDRYGHRDRNSRDESTSWLGDDAPPDGYVETYGLGTKQEPRNRDERNSRPKAPPDGYTERHAYGAPGKDRPSGLYVWVRDGVVTLNRDGRQVEVAAGNAAVATEDHMALLDHVPNFMRFDDTPTPSDGGRRFPDAFRATDGSAMGACTVR